MVFKKTTIYLCLYAVLLVVLRVYYTKSNFYLFMLWNLFLAIVPYLLSAIIVKIKSKLWFVVLLPIWLVFLPNAPYMLTDLFHLQQGNLTPIWFDLLLIITFSTAGMLLFYGSLLQIFRELKVRFAITIAYFSIAVILLMSSFGIYLGRYLRWNTWNIIDQPVNLFKDIFHRIINPFQYPKVWGITVGFGFLFWIGFLFFKTVDSVKSLSE